MSGVENMAIDFGLMNRARQTGEAVLRIYTWASPTLSLGRNQTAIDRYKDNILAERGIGIVRRPTGGRAILHWREVTYSVTAPSSENVGLRQSYDTINRILTLGLSSLGVITTISGGVGRTERPSESPCFASPTTGEMMLEGQKLVGSAQWREDSALLQHGSILLADDQTAIQEFTVHPVPAPQVATLSEALGRTPSNHEVAGAMFHALDHLTGKNFSTSELPLAEATSFAAPYLEFFSDKKWTWRR